MMPSRKLAMEAEPQGWNDHSMLTLALNFLDTAVGNGVQQMFYAFVDEKVEAENRTAEALTK